MVQRRAKVVAHRRAARDHYLLTLRCSPIARRAKAGQFVHVRCPVVNGGGLSPLLRRPFSVFDADPRHGTVALIYKVVGRGTEALRHARVGDSLDVLGPLGTPFTVAPDVRQAVLIGGGVGIPPLYFLAKRLLKPQEARGREAERMRVTAFLGARTKDWLICVREFRRLGVPVHLATDDGTTGFQGSVVDLAAGCLRSTKYHVPATVLYVCGPTPMMAAAARLAKRWGIPAQVSLEERMGCAMGVCMGCIVEIVGPHATAHKQFQRVCTEGPVFDAGAVVWRARAGWKRPVAKITVKGAGLSRAVAELRDEER